MKPATMKTIILLIVAACFTAGAKDQHSLQDYTQDGVVIQALATHDQYFESNGYRWTCDSDGVSTSCADVTSLPISYIVQLGGVWYLPYKQGRGLDALRAIVVEHQVEALGKGLHFAYREQKTKDGGAGICVPYWKNNGDVAKKKPPHGEACYAVKLPER